MIRATIIHAAAFIAFWWIAFTVILGMGGM